MSEDGDLLYLRAVAGETAAPEGAQASWGSPRAGSPGLHNEGGRGPQTLVLGFHGPHRFNRLRLLPNAPADRDPGTLGALFIPWAARMFHVKHPQSMDTPAGFAPSAAG